MKNYYFNGYLNMLDENVVCDCDEVCYVVVNDVKKFKAFCDKINLINYGVTSIGIYCLNWECGEWQRFRQDMKSPIYNWLIKYLNKIGDNIKNNKEKLFNYSIEFKNGDFILEENCNKSFDEIFNSIKDLYSSAISAGNVKTIIFETN